MEKLDDLVMASWTGLPYRIKYFVVKEKKIQLYRENMLFNLIENIYNYELVMIFYSVDITGTRTLPQQHQQQQQTTLLTSHVVVTEPLDEDYGNDNVRWVANSSSMMGSTPTVAPSSLMPALAAEHSELSMYLAEPSSKGFFFSDRSL